MLEVLLLLAVIRIRGRTGIRRPMEDTLIKLRLTRINHMVLLPEDNVYKGMLQRAKDYVTWGEVTKDVLVEALRERALLRGRKKPSEEDLKEKLGVSSFEDMADEMLKGKLLSSFDAVVPVLRLHPPRGGYEFIRKQYHNGGSTGYRGEEINLLIRKMLKPGVDLNGKKEN